jgi:hypothetical protein
MPDKDEVPGSSPAGSTTPARSDGGYASDGAGLQGVQHPSGCVVHDLPRVLGQLCCAVFNGPGDLKWVAYAAALLVVLEPISPLLPHKVFSAAIAVVALLVPGMIGVAIHRYGCTTSTGSSTAPWCTACSLCCLG